MVETIPLTVATSHMELVPRPMEVVMIHMGEVKNRTEIMGHIAVAMALMVTSIAVVMAISRTDTKLKVTFLDLKALKK